MTDDVSAILAHATIGAISDGGTLTAGVITWPQFTLAALNGSKTLTFEATLNTSFPDGTTHLPNAVVVIGTGSNCTPSAEQNADCKTDTTVTAAPNIHAVKTVDGEHVTSANPGDVLHYAITVTNSGDAAGTADVTDDVSAILAHATIGAISDGGTLTAGVITWPQFTLAALNGSKTLTFEATLDTSFPDGTTHLPNAVVVIGTGSNCTAERRSRTRDCKTDTTVDTFSLVIDKTNDAPLADLVLPDRTVVELPTADEGVDGHLHARYTFGGDPRHRTGSSPTSCRRASSTWIAARPATPSSPSAATTRPPGRCPGWPRTVTENGSVTYKALVLKGAQRAGPAAHQRRLDRLRPDPAGRRAL